MHSGTSLIGLLTRFATATPSFSLAGMVSAATITGVTSCARAAVLLAIVIIASDLRVHFARVHQRLCPRQQEITEVVNCRDISIRVGFSSGLKMIARFPILTVAAPVAQLDRASVFGTDGWGFESLRAYWIDLHHIILGRIVLQFALFFRGFLTFLSPEKPRRDGAAHGHR